MKCTDDTRAQIGVRFRRLTGIRSTLLLALGVIAVLQTATGARLILDAWKSYELAVHAEELNRVSDALFKAVANLGFERGRVNVVLNDAGPPSATEKNRQFIASRRQDANEALATGFMLWKELGSQRGDAELQAVKDAFEKIGDFRRRVDPELLIEKSQRTPGLAKEWFAAMTGLIEKIDLLQRSIMFDIRNADIELERLAHLKSTSLSLRNTAGPEISILTATMYSGKPISEELVQKVSGLEGETRLHLKTLQQLSDGTDNQTVRVAFQNLEDQYRTGYLSKKNEVFSAARHGGPYPISNEKFLASGVKALSQIAEFMNVVVVETTELAGRKRAEAKSALMSRSGIFIAGLVFLGAVILVVHLRVIKPLGQMTGAMGQLSQGNLDTRIPATRRMDEVGAMARALKIFKDHAQQLRDENEARQKAEEALRESEDRFRKLFNNSPVAMAIARLDDGIIVEGNDAWFDLIGRTRDEVIGRRTTDLGLWDEPELRAHLVELVVQNGGFSGVEVQHRKKDGTPIPLLTSACLVTLNGVVHGISTSVDISDRKRTEKALRESEERIRAIFESVDDFIFLKDRELRFTHVNQALAKSFGKTVEEVIGCDDFDLSDTEDAEAIRKLDLKILAGEKVHEEFSRQINGLRRTIDTSKVPLRDQSGTIIGVCGVGRDVSEHKRLEEVARRAQRLQAVGQLTGGIAHEFNNMLQAIQSCLELVKKGAENDSTRGLVEIALAAGDRGARLTAHLLAFSQKQMLRPETIDIPEWFGTVQDLLVSTLGDEIGVDVHVEGHVGKVHVDPHGLETAVLNLALNARAAMPEGGTLSLSARNLCFEGETTLDSETLPPGRYVEIAVTDTGCGMPNGVRARAFEPFVTTRDIGEGSGLGLSMVFGFARQSGGLSTIESDIGRGTTVRILLPAVEPEKSQGAFDDGVPEEPSFGGGKALIVEDDPMVLNSTTLLLESFGYRVRTADHALSALEILAAEPDISLLVTDMVMPNSMSGVDLAEQATHGNPNLQVLIVSGYPEIRLEESGLPKTGFKWLSKPFSAAQLRHALESLNSE